MKLIDADALLKRIDTEREQLVKVGMLGAEHTVTHYVRNFIEDDPAVDAVGVVRCKDCKHRDPEDKKCDCGHDIMWQLPRTDEWFCADGERRKR